VVQLHRKEIDPLFDAFPGIETERLSLRRMNVGDAPALFDMLSHSDVARFTARKPLARVSDAVDLLRGVGLEYATRRSIRWGVTLLGEDKIMATVGLHDWDRYHRHISIGFDVAFEEWGNGYGSEMVAAICAYAFDHLSVHRVEAHIMKGNRGSKKMLEGIGFEIEGVLRKRMYKDGHQHDTQLFSLVAHREDWTH
jgi:ribosomal-protein-alanine N-acetyltransferase